MHAWAQAAEMKLARAIKRHDFSAVIDTLGQVVDQLAKLVYRRPVRTQRSPTNHSVAAPHVVSALTGRVGKPSLVLVRVGIPGASAKSPEIGGVVITSEVTKQFGNGGLPGALAGRYERETVVCHIIFEVDVDDGQTAFPGSLVDNPDALVDKASADVQVLFHRVFSRGCLASGLNPKSSR